MGLIMKSDAQLQNDVLAELHWDPSINASEIGVEVKSGVVSLTGEVSTFAEKMGTRTHRATCGWRDGVGD